MQSKTQTNPPHRLRGVFPFSTDRLGLNSVGDGRRVCELTGFRQRPWGIPRFDAEFYSPFFGSSQNLN
jgi:hypothetical protein